MDLWNWRTTENVIFRTVNDKNPFMYNIVAFRSINDSLSTYKIRWRIQLSFSLHCLHNICTCEDKLFISKILEWKYPNVLRKSLYDILTLLFQVMSTELKLLCPRIHYIYIDMSLQRKIKPENYIKFKSSLKQMLQEFYPMTLNHYC